MVIIIIWFPTDEIWFSRLLEVVLDCLFLFEPLEGPTQQ